ncbi:MAG TPA: hypothetical protein VMN03_14230, partial [Burkholderiales bacterium]|nr:hypothetical protein [Burkholderiales bacterium]
DLNKTEPLPASYNLVDAPAEDEKKAAGGAPEAAAPRQEAAVRGITPQQPAPVPVAREPARANVAQRPAAATAEDGSIIGKIFGFFRRRPEAAPAAGSVVQPATPERTPRRGRHEHAERDSGRRDRDPARSSPQSGQRPRSSGQDRQRESRDGRDGSGRHPQRQERHPGERPQEPRRQDQGQRQPQHQQQRSSAHAQAGSGSRPAPTPGQQPPQGHQQPHDQGQGEPREGRGRRRRRGGRDRHEQRPAEGNPQQGRPQPQREPHRPAAERPSPALDVAADHLTSIATAAHAAETAVPASAPYPAPPPASSYETEQVREFHPREAASLESPAPAEPVRIEWPSDLQQIESDPGKVQAAQQETVVEQPAPRPRRVRPPAPHVSEEPLVQIETGSETETSGSGEKTLA